MISILYIFNSSILQVALHVTFSAIRSTISSPERGLLFLTSTSSSTSSFTYKGTTVVQYIWLIDWLINHLFNNQPQSFATTHSLTHYLPTLAIQTAGPRSQHPHPLIASTSHRYFTLHTQYLPSKQASNQPISPRNLSLNDGLWTIDYGCWWWWWLP